MKLNKWLSLRLIVALCLLPCCLAIAQTVGTTSTYSCTNTGAITFYIVGGGTHCNDPHITSTGGWSVNPPGGVTITPILTHTSPNWYDQVQITFTTAGTFAIGASYSCPSNSYSGSTPSYSFQVYAPVTPTVSITSDRTSICRTQQVVTFTAHPTNQGATPTYIWLINGVVQAGASAVTYSSSMLNNGDAITCKVVSSMACATSTSAASNGIPITVTIPATVSPAIITTKPSGVCSGEAIGFSLSGANIGASPTVTWKINGNLAPASDNPGLGPLYLVYNTWNFPTNSTVQCFVTSSATCVSPTSAAPSNTVIVTINAKVNFLAGIVPSPNRPNLTYCPGEISFYVNPVNATPSTYSWTKNTDPSVYSTQPTYTPASFVQGDYVTVTVTTGANACLNNTSVTTDTKLAPIVIRPYVSTGPITCDICTTNTRCQGAGTTAFSSTVLNSDAFSWSIDTGGSINGSTGVVTWTAGFFGTATISVTATGCGAPATTYRQIVVKPLMYGQTVPITVKVNGVFISYSPAFICPNDQVDFLATVPGGTPAVGITWLKGTGGGAANIDPSANISFAHPNSYTYVMSYAHWTDLTPTDITVRAVYNDPCLQGSATFDSSVSCFSSLSTTVVSAVDGSTFRCQALPGTTQFVATNAPAGPAYNWSFVGGQGTINSSGIVTWSPTTPGLGFIHYTVATCPAADAYVNYTINAAPALPANYSATFCNWEKIILSPDNAGADNNWYDYQGNFIRKANTLVTGPILQTGTYQYQWEVVSADKCKALSKAVVQVNITDNCDNRFNWLQSTSFNENAVVLSDKRDYFDFNGSILQQQLKNISANGKIFVSQSVLDNHGRVALVSLPAAITPAVFTYQPAFIKTTESNAFPVFDALDFDEPSTKFSPTSLDISTVGTLGWYYSANNNVEPLTPVSDFPYNRAEFYADGSSSPSRVSGAGSVLRLGGGHEPLVAAFPIYKELDDYRLRRLAAFGLTENQPGLNHFYSGLQQVSKDENGDFSIQFLDKSGKVVMAAMKGTATDFAVNNVVSGDVALGVTYNPLVYFYLLDDQPVTMGGTGTYAITNLVTHQSFTPVTPPAKWPAGFYSIRMMTGAITIAYTNYFKNISYNYYDDASHLRVSISPNGIKQLNAGVNYSLIDKSTYSYNHQGWLLTMTTPETGATKYVYRKDGRIRFSQNALQQASNRFSYTHYDRTGRPTESGEYIGGIPFTPMTDPNFFTSAMGGLLEQTAEQLTWPATDIQYWTRTHYDKPALITLPMGYTQDFLRGAVSWTENSNIATYYSYNELGRTTWTLHVPNSLILQSGPTLSLGRSFLNVYTHDLQGKVLQVQNITLQGNVPFDPERFFHHFEYDPNGRLLNALTSLNGTAKTLRAHYEYYLHGPLKRVELGQLQGIDFVYNINGWLKSINNPDNSPGMDPGKDGEAGAHAGFKKDAFGLILDYYESSLSGLLTSSTDNQNGPERFHRIPLIEMQSKAIVENNDYQNNLQELNTTLIALKRKLNKGRN